MTPVAQGDPAVVALRELILAKLPESQYLSAPAPGYGSTTVREGPSGKLYVTCRGRDAALARWGSARLNASRARMGH